MNPSFHTLFLFFLVLFPVFFSGGALAQPLADDAVGVKGPYQIGPGDVLDITVFQVEELSKPAVVDAEGAVSLPLIGTVAVAGKTPLEVERELQRLYADGLLKNPQISVAVKKYQSQPVSVVGAVERPGVYQLKGRRRLLDVIAMAGGLTSEAGRTVTVERAATQGSSSRAAARTAEAADGSGREIHVNAAELLEAEGDDPSNPLIRPHDVVRVSRAGVVYVLGAVNKPGGFPIEDQEKMTVLRAVSLASGFDRHAAPQKARLIRASDEGGSELPVRVKDIIQGKAPDRELHEEDILFIPDSRIKAALSRGTEAFIRTVTGVVIWRR